MRIAFFEPPPVQKLGGLDTAIKGLKGALENAGHEVVVNADVNADIVHFHGLWQPSFLKIAKACGQSRIPYVVSPHGMLEPWAWKHRRWKKLPYYHLFEKHFLNNSTALFSTAQSESSNLHRFLPDKKIFTIPLGLSDKVEPRYRESRDLLGWKADECVLLFLSRIHPKKGLDLLLRATSGLKRSCRLVIVGEGDSNYIRSLKKIKNQNVEWVGPVWGGERWKYFQGADLFCLPSHSENFGLAVLEACQVGTPILTTVNTPWADFLKEQPAYICEPSLQSVTNALHQFEATPTITNEERNRLATWTQQHFSWDILARQYIASYESLLLAG